MKALITGIEGFVARYLADFLLSQGVEIIGTYKPGFAVQGHKISTVPLDVMDSAGVNSIVKEIKPNYIFHLAAQSSVANSWRHPSLTIDVNVIGAFNILEAIKTYSFDSRLLLVGSGEEYGLVKQDLMPIGEETKPNPNNPYALSKLTQGYAGLLYHRTYGVNVYLARPFNHSGPGQAIGFVIPDFCKQIADIEVGKSEPVIRVGNLEAKRDFSDVRDIVKAYWMIVEKGRPGEIYNIGSGKATSIADILKFVVSKAYRTIEIVVDEAKYRPVDTPIIVCDNTRLIRETGWKQEYDLKQTLCDVLDYWRQQNAYLYEVII